MYINNIYNLKYKKGELFENDHIVIKYDNMYLSYEFVEYLKRIYGTLTLTIKGNKRLTLYFKYDYVSDRGTDNKIWKLCGYCGDWGFGDRCYTGKYSYGVRVRRKAIKKIINLYLKSHFSIVEKREEKLLKILQNIEQCK